MLRFIHIIFILQSFLSLVAQGSTYVRTKKIDRKAVVERHCPVWNELTGVTTLGNGEFAFNCDATGLQTFAGNTLSNWGWHCYPLPPGVNPEDKKRIPFETHGRIRYYLAPSAPVETQLVRWLYDNPHRMNLGRISFRGTNGSAIKSDEINILSRRYDIWTGSVESCFEYKGQQVNVITVCHPNKDAVSVRIESNLLKWKDILFETTEMMLDFVAWDEKIQRYILGPPVMSGAEGNSGFESWNSTSELNYWALSLEISKSWRERLGLPANEKLEHVLTHLSRPTVVNDVYIDAESHPGIWNFSEDGFIRPAWPEVYGCIPGPLIDPQIMERTYEKISEDIRCGQWKGNLWGCDYPMLAMTAARLGKPSEAVDWLLFDTPFNEYSPGGYNAGWYLPGNGGFLWAVALMAAGWDDCHIYDEKDNIIHAPGFPKDGNWIICYEGINRVP